MENFIADKINKLLAVLEIGHFLKRLAMRTVYGRFLKMHLVMARIRVWVKFKSDDV